MGSGWENGAPTTNRLANDDNLRGLDHEAAFALAHINFDFSLVKMEAPQEIQQLGKSLSYKRRTEAEDGATHAIARKLGALFADDVAPVLNFREVMD